jgi:hypothetical protein
VCERMRELKDVVRNRSFFASFSLAYYINNDKRMSRPLSHVDRSVTRPYSELARKEEDGMEGGRFPARVHHIPIRSQPSTTCLCRSP